MPYVRFKFVNRAIEDKYFDLVVVPRVGERVYVRSHKKEIFTVVDVKHVIYDRTPKAFSHEIVVALKGH